MDKDRMGSIDTDESKNQQVKQDFDDVVGYEDIWDKVNVNYNEDWDYCVNMKDSTYEQDMTEQYNKKVGRIPYRARKRVKVAVGVCLIGLIGLILVGLLGVFPEFIFFVILLVYILVVDLFLTVFLAIDWGRFERLYNPDYINKGGNDKVSYMVIGIVIGFMWGITFGRVIR